jgi:hypothetical protein
MIGIFRSELSKEFVECIFPSVEKSDFTEYLP